MQLLTSIAIALLALSATASTTVYELTMRLKVPRVYDNGGSLGYRKYQSQRLKGVVTVAADGTATMSLTNLTHRVGGVRVTYSCIVEKSQFHLVGDNYTQVFRRPSVVLSVSALPSYVPSYSPTDDESLVLTLSGSGTTAKRISGCAAGNLGCGCAFYGHTSPTRTMFGMRVVDTAATFGTFRMIRRK